MHEPEGVNSNHDAEMMLLGFMVLMSILIVCALLGALFASREGGQAHDHERCDSPHPEGKGVRFFRGGRLVMALFLLSSLTMPLSVPAKVAEPLSAQEARLRRDIERSSPDVRIERLQQTRTGAFALIVRYRSPHTVQQAQLIQAAADALGRIGRLTAGSGLGFEDVAVVVDARFSDREGRAHERYVLTLSLPAAELVGIDWSQIEAAGLLDRARLNLNDQGRRAASAYCRASADRALASDFCRRVSGG